MDKVKSKQYDLIKTITTFLVVIAHATKMYTGNGVVIPAIGSELLSNLTKTIYSFHMPLFMCVSGMVYGMCIDDFGKYNDTKKFISKKAVRLLIPYCVFGLLTVAPVMTIFNFEEESYINYAINGIGLVKNARHLWFIFTLFLIFVICAFCKKIIQNCKPYYVFPVLLIISFLSDYMPATFQLNMLMYYLLFFYMGYVINKNYEKISKCCKNPLILLITAIVVLMLFKQGMWIIKVIVATSGIAFMFGIVQYINLKICDGKLYGNIKKNSFGVYLFHPMIIYVLYYYFGDLNINPILLCSMIIVITYLISHFATSIVRKLKLGIIIGE